MVHSVGTTSHYTWDTEGAHGGGLGTKLAGKGTGGAEAEARFVLKEYLHMNKGVFLKLYVTDLQNNISVIIFFYFWGVASGGGEGCWKSDAESLLIEACPLRTQ